MDRGILLETTSTALKLRPKSYKLLRDYSCQGQKRGMGSIVFKFLIIQVPADLLAILFILSQPSSFLCLVVEFTECVLEGKTEG